MKKWLSLAGATVIIAGAVATGGVMDEGGPPIEIIDSEEINGVVVYRYATDIELPVQDHEDISKRTENSIHFEVGKDTYTARMFQGEPFVEIDNDWFLTNVATATPEVFEEMDKEFIDEGPITWIKKAYADIIYSGAGDGHVAQQGSDWTTVHDALTGNIVDYTSTTAITQSFEDVFSSILNIYRGFIPIDTSSIPDGSTITAAILNVYITASNAGDNDGNDWINVVQSSQASNTQLVVADYDQDGAITNPTEGSTRRDISSQITNSAYNTWTLNSTGRGWVSTTGYTLLGLREGHDAINNAITNNTGVTGITWSTSENTGTTQDPYLDVTYSNPATGRVFINGGTFLNGQMIIQP